MFKKKENIENWLNRYGIRNYELIEDIEYGYIVNVYGNVFLYNKNLVSIDIKFNEVKGYFNCSDNNLNSLKGCPEIVKGSFFCDNNKLTSLKYSPKFIKGNFYCENNKLISLEGGPKEVDSYYCNRNNLKTLKGISKINKNIDCSYNKLTSLEFCQEVINGDIDCSFNKITEINIKIVTGNLLINNNEYISLKNLVGLDIAGKVECNNIGNNIKSLIQIYKEKINIEKVFNNDINYLKKETLKL